MRTLCLFLLSLCLWGRNGPVIWVVPSLERVLPSDPAGRATAAPLAAGRGEYESFQIIVRAPGNSLTHVNVTVSDLAAPGGQIISKKNLALFREQYVYVNQSSPNWGGSNQPLGPAWYPDGLIPFLDPTTGVAPSRAPIQAVPCTVEEGKNQPFWVDVYVPSTASAGSYSGTFTVTSDQGHGTGQISLRVWNFTLPRTPTLQSSFAFSQAGTLAAEEELLRNKVSPLNVNVADEADLADRYGLKATNLGFFTGADVSHCTISAMPRQEDITEAVAKQHRGLTLYDFLADEIGGCTSLFPQMKQWALAMHHAGVRNLVTMAPVPELLDDGSGTGRSAVDIWAVLPVTYDKAVDRIAKAVAKGDEVWSYNTLVQDGYSPKWEIDFAPINFRIQPGFISQSLNLSGLLYWRVDMWSGTGWNNVNNAGEFSSSNYPGEGMLVYPGPAAGIRGVAPSMRLKWIRDGVEDYEYVVLLKKAGYGDWALAIARSVGADWTKWTRDIGALESARRQLGEKLNALASKGDSQRQSDRKNRRTPHG